MRASFAGALARSIPRLPFFATALIVAIYAAADAGVLQGVPAVIRYPVLSGTATAVLLTALSTIFSTYVLHATSPANANPEQFSQIQEHLSGIRTSLSRLSTAADEPFEVERYAHAALKAYHSRILVELGASSAGWALGSGYVALWRLIHKAEQICVLINPAATVMTEAWLDDLRLMQTHISYKNELHTGLVGAIQVLAQGFGVHLSALAPGPTTALDESKSEPLQVSVARHQISLVRQTLDELSEGAYSAQVRIRQRNLSLVTFCGAAVYVLAALVVGARAKPATDLATDPMIAGAVLFVVGSLVGLFHSLQVQTERDMGAWDSEFGASVSALAAVRGGMAGLIVPVLVALAISTINPVVTPVDTNVVVAQPANGDTVPSAAPSGSSTGQPLLEDIYNLRTNPSALVAAAVAGLAAELLVGTRTLMVVESRFEDATSNLTVR